MWRQACAPLVPWLRTKNLYVFFEAPFSSQRDSVPFAFKTVLLRLPPQVINFRRAAMMVGTLIRLHEGSACWGWHPWVYDHLCWSAQLSIILSNKASTSKPHLSFFPSRPHVASNISRPLVWSLLSGLRYWVEPLFAFNQVKTRTLSQTRLRRPH